MHSFPQSIFQILLAMRNLEVYSPPQIEPGSLKNFAAQLNEGAMAERPLRPQFFATSVSTGRWISLHFLVRDTKLACRTQGQNSN
jgi:hypothetical protein